ncbi:type IV secretion system protein VirB11 [Pseudorhizobium tarimense]|uniref:Type IV secretion system protein VirB11 n=1 Tax=Pseudorhizobium tarimense TaxID=1079109 RepID=A0ABV2HCY9_9HYPH|nr:P-type conjugative transfer ATPase TrbB [Pseudorhizobium tarimense]MCJ8521161.1 P-type conjugative transfer ATPase TrbB [Pseudorhizobium tarimense]
MTPSKSSDRLIRKLSAALGTAVCDALNDSEVVEIMLNPDGKLFLERLGERITLIGDLSAEAAEVAIGAVAHALGAYADRGHPIVSGELPLAGRYRFEGLLPPVVSSPSFSIRRHLTRVLSLDDYVVASILTPAQAQTIREAVQTRRNIIVSGGTGSGKTTLATTIIGEMIRHSPQDRLVMLEDTPEIQCSAANIVSLRTSAAIDMSKLLRSALRLRPDRIVVGEVRDGAALSLLKAWNTGHPGGVATVHSNTARSTLQRLEQLTGEVSQQPMCAIIGEAVDVVISIERTAKGRRISEILQVTRFAGGEYQCASYGEIRHAA